MGKYTNEDAEKLRQYFENYELEHIFLNAKFVDEFKKVHKKALGYLVIYSEMEKQNTTRKCLDNQALFYFKESVSDVLQSVFAWVNGAYKASDLLLRSSIENFNKTIIGNVNPNIYTEKSVFKIFDMADQMDVYQIMIGKEPLSIVLHRIYSELCKTTHTATTADMDHITALNLLPKYEKEKTVEFRKKFEVLIDAYLGFFLANYKEVVDSMHRCNVDIFYEVISKNIIRSVVNS